MTTKQEIAKEMLGLYDGKPSRWTQGVYRQYDESSKACAWCLLGALEAISERHAIPYSVQHSFCVEVKRRTGEFPEDWNDASERKFHEVWKLLADIAEDAP